MLLTSMVSGEGETRAHATTTYPATYVYAEGYDTCVNLSNAQLSAFYSPNTPNYFVGLYLGGSDGAASGIGCTGHGAAQWNYADSLGYAIEPFWYGSQMPTSCGGMSGRPNYISLNTSSATTQGEDEASDATAAASSTYGLAAGSPIYADLEGFTNNSGCLAAAQAFVNGWSYEMKVVKGTYSPGLYGSSCSSYLSNMSGLSYVPAEIAPDDSGVDTTGVYGLDCLPDTKWDHNQRIHQSLNSVVRSFNGQTINSIDEDCADGPLVFRSSGLTVTVNKCASY
jgi:hypothetical protein